MKHAAPFAGMTNQVWSVVPSSLEPPCAHVLSIAPKKFAPGHQIPIFPDSTSIIVNHAGDDGGYYSGHDGTTSK